MFKLFQRQRRRFAWLREATMTHRVACAEPCGGCTSLPGLLDYRRRGQKVNFKRVITGFTLLMLFAAATLRYQVTKPLPDSQDVGYLSRHLLSSNAQENTTSTVHTTSHGASWEKCDFEKANTPTAWLFVHFFAISIIFIALALICDDFFVPSLEVISEKLSLSEDVAGATFMAAGSSAPELFTSVAGVAVQTDVGVGTIVGSAVFNLLIIIALTAALAGQVLHLDWRPIIRDSFFYAMSLCCFIIFAWDGFIQHYEAVILLILYTAYIVLMVFNPKLMEWMATWRISCCVKSSVFPSASSQESQSEPNGTAVGSMGNGTTHANAHATSESNANGNTSFSRVGERPEGLEVDHIFHHRRGSVATMLISPGQRSSKLDQSLEAGNGDLASTGGIEMNSRRVSDTNALPGSLDHAGLPAITETPAAANGHPGQRGADSFKVKGQQNVLPAIGAGAGDASVNYYQNKSGNGDSRLQLNSTQMAMENHTNTIDKHSSRHSLDGDSDSDDGDIYQLCPCLPCCPVIRGANPPTSENARTKNTFVEWLKFILRWVLFVPSFPFLVLFSWTVPDCSKEHNRQWFLVSFIASVTWIALLSFAMVTIVGRVGCILDIDNYIMGLCIIAIGTSIPDAISSILVARDGYGDMAVSNAIGSNVFDINLGIGLPFLIRIIIDRGVPISLLDATELTEFNNGTMAIVPHVKFGFILLMILLLALFMFVVAGFRLSRNIGIGFVVVYVIFMAYAFIQEIYCIRKLGKYC